MKLKQLESILSDLRQFEKPKIELEQYPTTPHIAAVMLLEVFNEYDNFENLSVADLGCGCGTLAIGAAALGAGHVIGVDIDTKALELAQENCEEAEVDVDLVHGSISSTVALPLREKSVDVVIMNPPFGCRQSGADVAFLQRAMQVATVAVYSLHKSSTRRHIHKVATQQYGAKSAKVVSEVRFNISRSYKFHKSKEVDIDVDLWKFVVGERA